jgi:hypothetical protein
MQLRIEVDEVTGRVDVTLYERRAPHALGRAAEVYMPGSREYVDVATMAEAPISFSTTEDRLADLLIANAKDLAL